MIQSVTRLHNARIGEKSEIDKLLKENASLGYFIPAADQANHENLGQGIPVPPLIDVAGMASNLARNAAKVVIP